jgi:hypothetical protein
MRTFQVIDTRESELAPIDVAKPWAIAAFDDGSFARVLPARYTLARYANSRVTAMVNSRNKAHRDTVLSCAI